MKIKDEEQNFMRSNEALDVGALEIVNDISERTKSLAVCANFTKLLIDVGKPLVNSELIREYYKELDDQGNRIPISMNYQGYRFFERLDSFYLEYHKLLIESMEFLEPEYILNIHSHDSDQVQSQNDVILYNPDSQSIMMRAIQDRLE